MWTERVYIPARCLWCGLRGCTYLHGAWGWQESGRQRAHSCQVRQKSVPLLPALRPLSCRNPQWRSYSEQNKYTVAQWSRIVGADTRKYNKYKNL